MCETLPPPLFPELMCSAEVSPASPTPSQGSGRAALMSVTSGVSSPELLVRLGPAGWWLRTCAASSAAMTPLLEEARVDSSGEFSETWPASGSMRSGTVSRLPPLVPTTRGNASSLWPTPQVGMIHAEKYTPETSWRHYRDRSHQVHLSQAARDARMWPTPTARDFQAESLNAAAKRNSPTLPTAARLWPTPCAQDGKNSTLPPSLAGRDSIPGEVMRRIGQADAGNSPAPLLNGKKKPNPKLSVEFVTWLMGFPSGWTDIE